MKMHDLLRVFLAVLGTSQFVTQTQGQSLLYDNGPVTNANGVYEALIFNEGYKITDSFTLAVDSTISNATISTMANAPGDTLKSLLWSITTAPLGGTALASGSATTIDTYLFSNGALPMYSDSFSITPVNLDAGTYWLQLYNGITVSNTSADWNVSDGPSAAYASGSGGEPSESFQLYGTITGAPEPSTVMLALVGGLGLVCLRRRK